MKCKVFKLHALKDSGEHALNDFLETVNVKQIFAQIVGGEDHFWSILVFYEDVSAKSENNERAVSPANTFSTTDKPKRSESSATKSIVLSPEQELIFNELKKWRNEKALREGIPPYLIAHNFSLVQIAASSVKSKEELVEIKGFGEKRAEKYGDEILEILGAAADVHPSGD